jgi:hypothetical protein
VVARREDDAHAKTRTTPVRTAVARFDGTPLMPILARIAVADAVLL